MFDIGKYKFISHKNNHGPHGVPHYCCCVINCFHSSQNLKDADDPYWLYGMSPNEDGSRLHTYTSSIKINRLNLSSTYFLMKNSYKTEVYGRMDDYPDYEAYLKALNKNVETLTFKGSCKVIKQEDLKF